MLRRIAVLVVVSALAMAAAAPVALAGDPALGPEKSPQVIIQTVECNGDVLELSVMAPRPGENSAKFGRPGVGHVAGSTAKLVAQGIRAEISFDGGTTFAVFDEYHWGNGKETPTECVFFIDPGGGVIVRVTVFVFEPGS